MGQYFTNRWLYGEPAETRVDPFIDFQWDSYITATGKDYISVRWTGYTSLLMMKNLLSLYKRGAKLFVDGELLIDQFDFMLMIQMTQLHLLSTVVLPRRQ